MRLDVVWVDNKDHPIVAFELDSCKRKISIRKLQTVNSAERYWFFFGNPDNIKQFINNVDPDRLVSVIKFPWYLLSSKEMQQFRE